MNAPRATPEHYIQFLIGTPMAVSATEAARVQPATPNAPAHDALGDQRPGEGRLGPAGVRRVVLGDRGVPSRADAFTGVERCPVRAARGQRNHIGGAIRAFVRLEYHRVTTGVSWFAAKAGIIREAVRAYLTSPRLTLPGATA